MSKFIQLGKSSEFQDKTLKEVTVQGREILLARIGDKYYAANNRCPHMGGKLVQGKLEGTIVTCPRHGSQFDLTDGRVVRWLKGSGLVAALVKVVKPPTPLTTYAVKVEDDKIVVEI